MYSHIHLFKANFEDNMHYLKRLKIIFTENEVLFRPKEKCKKKARLINLALTYPYWLSKNTDSSG